MREIKLLIVEDEDAQIQTYNDVIEQHNKKQEQKFGFDVFKTFADAENALKTPYYDAAIIDLKLSSTDELEGKKLVESVYKKLRIPIIIYSGSIAQIDDITENALLRKRLRTDKFLDVLNDVIEIYKTGITQILRPAGEVDEKLTQIFWDHLSKDLDIWIKHKNPNTLLRYIFAHFQEYLEINSTGDFEEYHPQEVYIKPPIKINLHTGDFVKFNDEFYLVLTPACDIVIQTYEEFEDGTKKPKRKADNIILVKANEFDYKSLCIDKKGNVDKSKIKNYVTNSSYRYHYLPPSINDVGFLVDFQEITSIDFSEPLDRVATIATPFIKDIISRFSNYYSRQGQPTFYQDSIVEQIFKTANSA